MFTELRAENFKSWRHLPRVSLSPITAIFGTNSSGKTSLLQILLLMKQTAQSVDRSQPLQFGGEQVPVELGSLRDVLYRHDMDSQLVLGFAWRPKEPFVVADPNTANDELFSATEIGFEVTVEGGAKGAARVSEFHYTAAQNRVSLARGRGSKARRAEEYNLSATINGRDDYLQRVRGRPWPLPAPVKSYGFPDEATAYFQNSGFVADFELALDRQFGSNTFYLGPLRSLPSRQYRWQGGRPQDVGFAGERAVEVLLASQGLGRTNTRAYNAAGHAKRLITLEEHVAQWLQELGLISSFSVQRISEDADIYRVLVQRRPDSAAVALTDVGFGVSQILPVLVLLAWAPRGSTVILEQPEIHLHPAVQSGLAQVIFEATKVRGIQVLVESHSEHLLRRLQLLAAQGDLPPEHAALYFCEMRSDGQSHIEPLQLNLYGEIENWPEGFFGDPLSETAAIVKAGLRRKRAAQSRVE